MSYRFSWDSKKDSLNIKKHGVSFLEAKSVFFDEKAVEFYDEKHSVEEERFIMLGMSIHLNLLMVCHCIREGELIRIISARKATKLERTHY